MNTLDIFLSRINKTYSNKAQHTENPLLPQAVHITTPVNERIKNLPENFEDVFVIDETYYHYDDHVTQLHHLSVIMHNRTAEFNWCPMKSPANTQSIHSTVSMYSSCCMMSLL